MNADSKETNSLYKKLGLIPGWRWVTVILVFLIFAVSVITGIKPIGEIRGGTAFYDIHGTLITTTATPDRIEIPLSDMSPHLLHAFIAVEDSRFYKHPGLDPIGIARALLHNIQRGRIVAGGSTITQQLAKNMYLPATRSFKRKLAEVVLSFYLEIRFSKNEILERYLNLVYLGHGAYGVEAGAHLYFGKRASDLSLAEASMLAGITRAPFYYSPYRDLDIALDRMKTVINRMLIIGYISEDEAKNASNEIIQTVGLGRRETRPAPYFMDYVIDETLKLLGDEGALLYSGNLKIHTSLDIKFQHAAEKAFAKGLDALTPQNTEKKSTSQAKIPIQPQGALVVLDPRNGHIKALIGGRSYSETQFNRALQAMRQPGSSFKPFFYAAALDNGFTAASTLPCEPVTFYRQRLPYTPTDYGEFQYHFRWLTLREALVTSCNVVSVTLANIIGPETGMNLAKKLGVQSPLGPNLSLVLGTSEVTPFEMTLAFAPLANGGKRVQPIFITAIEDKQGKKLYHSRVRTLQVIDPRTAFIITDILKQVISPWGTARSISSRFLPEVAAKTGSTQGYTDAWIIGYTPNIVCSVYIGNDNPSVLLGKSGGAAAGPIFADFMEEVLRDGPVLTFQMPSEIVSVEICHETGYLASPGCPTTRRELFKDGTQPVYECPWHGSSFYPR
ncbi:MAG: PBP1A family penicillin-binding protein [Firmicutes bacterium]|nr:PBP1A family penicillin-binding protein [Bacillota bacterium]